MLTKYKLNTTSANVFDFNLSLVNSDLFNQLERKSTIKLSDEKSRAKNG
jgi:hypothetical protein